MHVPVRHELLVVADRPDTGLGMSKTRFLDESSNGEPEPIVAVILSLHSQPSWRLPWGGSWVVVSVIALISTLIEPSAHAWRIIQQIAA